jgi:hypothetical protein
VTVDPDSERLDAVESSRCIVLVAALCSAGPFNVIVSTGPFASHRPDLVDEIFTPKLKH